MSKKKTHEEFVRELEEKWPGKYTVLSVYVNNATKIKVKCNKCENEWDVMPYHILRETGCPQCNGGIRKDIKSFITELDKKYPGKWEVIGEYINSKTSIRVKCKICGYEKDVTPTALLLSGKCSYCSPYVKKTSEDFNKEIEERFQGKYTVLGTYINNNTRVKIRCNKCGCEWMAVPRTILNKNPSKASNCPQCSRINKKRKNEELWKRKRFEKELERKNPNKQEKNTKKEKSYLRTGVIYCVRNKVNGKVYIGQTIQGLKKRYEHHLQDAKNGSELKFHRAIRKYGKENFETIVIKENIPECELDYWEKFYIKEYDSVENGYNMSLGGSTPLTIRKLKEKDVIKIQDMLKNSKKPFSEIAKIFNVGLGHIYGINNGEAWHNSALEYPIRRVRNLIRNSLSEENVEEIIELLRENKNTLSQIAVKYSVSVTAISAINKGKSHKHEGILYPIMDVNNYKNVTKSL